MKSFADLPISMTAAKNSGSVLYFTGKPCKHGHIAPRRTVNQNCVECQKRYCQGFHTRNADKRRVQMRDYAKRDVEGNRRRSREYHFRRCGAGPGFSVEEFEELVKRYGGRCLKCGLADQALTADHVIPLSLGGINGIDNIQPLCHPCNSGKKDRVADYRDGR